MKLSLEAMAPVPHTVDLGESGMFELFLRPPSFAELVEDYADRDLVSILSRRIRVAVARWEGVEDEQGQPIPYSIQNLQRLCEVHPVAFSQVLKAAKSVFDGSVRWGDLDPKKSQPGLPGFSADTVLANLRSLPISPSGEQQPLPVPLAPQPQS